MIDKQDFKKIRERMAEYDLKREELIQKSREVLKLSKQLIYSLHRNNIKETNILLAGLRKEKQKLDKIASSDKKLFCEGSYSEAIQEYAEALTYYSFAANKKIWTISEVGASEEDYLMGICDLTGELTRKAVTIARRDKRGVEEIKKTVEEIFWEFLQLNLRNSELRKKSDAIKWNLKKLEEIMYDIE